MTTHYKASSSRLNEFEQFAHIVSHDLKSPITSVLAAIKLIEMGDITEQEFPEVGGMIRISCERMIDLIESLLASSALEMG